MSPGRSHSRALRPTLLLAAALTAWAVAVVAAAALPAAAQDEFVPEIPLTARFGIGARSLGMGGTGVAAADDLSALHLNPAALALVRRTEVSLTMAHRGVDVDATLDGRTRATALSKLRLNALGVVYPVKTYRGSLVFAAAVSQPRILDRDVRRTLAGDGRRESESERGGPLDWRGGLAVMVAPEVVLGGSFAVLTGKDERIFTQVAGGTSLTVRDESSILGWTGSLGALATIGSRVRLGATLFFPEHHDFEGTQIATERGGERDTTTSVRFVDEVDLPFAIGAGAALTLPGFVVTADFRATDWREIAFAGPLRLGDEDAYRSTMNWQAGVEWYLPWAPLRLRAGYQAEPLPYLLLPDFAGDPARTIPASIDEDRAFWTAGAGGLLAGHLAMDLALMRGDLRRSTAAYVEEARETRLLVTVSYRN